jgi:hypothetical protein
MTIRILLAVLLVFLAMACIPASGAHLLGMAYMFIAGILIRSALTSGGHDGNV